MIEVDNTNTFKDIDFKNFGKDLVGFDALDKSINNITTSKVGSIPSFPEFSDNSGILFEQLDTITMASYKSKIQSALSKYDNRIVLDDISFQKDILNPNFINVTISYKVRNTDRKSQTTIRISS